MFKDEKGSSLVVVLIAMLLLTVLGVSFAFSADTEGTLSTRSVNKTQAYHLARSGVELGYSKIEDNIEDYDDESYFSDLVPYDFDGDFNNIGEYEVSFEPTEKEENNEYKIEINSTGTVNNTSNISETVILDVELEVPEIIENPSEWFAGSSHNIQHLHANDNPMPEAWITLKSTDDHQTLSVTGQQVKLEAKSVKFMYDYGDQVINIANQKLHLGAKFIKFDGKVLFNHPNPGQFYLENSRGIQDEFDNYDFEEDEEYGVVYFEDREPVSKDGEKYYGPNSGYYFFPSGLEIHNEKFENDLIEVEGDDDIEEVIEMFKAPDIVINSKIWK